MCIRLSKIEIEIEIMRIIEAKYKFEEVEEVEEVIMKNYIQRLIIIIIRQVLNSKSESSEGIQ